MRFIIITGMSGGGKSNAVKSLEDMGYFCIDNLPPALLEKTGELCMRSVGISKIALVIDIRSREMFSALDGELDRLADRGVKYEILFLDANEQALIKRYKETRRRHPLSPDGNIAHGIAAERNLLSLLKDRAHHVLDTSTMATRELKAYIEENFATDDARTGLNITVTSFGFKYGLPPEADMVLDVRFLPNPFYIKELKGKTGMDEGVRSYVKSFEQTDEFIKKTNELLLFLIPSYIEEGKSHFSLCFGCTGGKHRSVTLACEMHEFLLNNGYNCRIEHRDIEKDKVDYL